MAYFLKISTQTKSKSKYLQIYESFWDKNTKSPKNKSFKKLGYLEDLISDSIPDPIAYWKDEIAKMNKTAKSFKENEKIKLIGDSVEKNIGYALIKQLYNTLDPKKDLDILSRDTKFQFNISELIEALIYARIVNPCSKQRTYMEVIPSLYGKYDFSLDQIYEGLKFIGNDYEKVIEIFNESYRKRTRHRDTSKVYFDCTNYYFEIDKEDENRRKGPSKEKRHDPIIGMGLLLDADQIPLSMHIYPGNQSEKPEIRKIIQDMKQRNNISGRTVQVADKGLNCSKNIYECINNGDGYIYSQSIKMLSDVEKNWVYSQMNNLTTVKDSAGTTLYSYTECVDTFNYTIKDVSPIINFKAQQKRILTFNEDLRNKQISEINKLVEKAEKLTSSKAKKNEYGDCGKYVNLAAINDDGEVIDSNIVLIDEEQIASDKLIAGYNVLITSETTMTAQEVYRTYHNLWKIEESFRILKSQLEARPIYVQTIESIKGHFLICYLSVFLLRITQYKRFKNKICANKLCEFIKNVKVDIQDETSDKCINLAKSSPTITLITEQTKQPFNNFYLKKAIIDRMLNAKINNSKN